MPRIQFFNEPVKFCIVYDYNTPDVVDKIKDQLKRMKGRLVDNPGTAKNNFGVPRKNNKGMFIYDKSHPIAIHGQGVMNYIKENIKEDNEFCSRLSSIDIFGRLVSYYQTGGYYRPHRDDAIVTCIYYLWDEPKTFEGGDLYFGDFKVPIENNSMLFFYSDTEHAVSTLTSGEGRWAITYFFGSLADRTRDEDSVLEFVNVLSKEELSTVEKFIKRPAWEFGQASFPHPADNTKPVDMVHRYPFWIMDLTEHPFFTDTLLKRIEDITFRKFRVKRVYANGQTHGQDGSWHFDDKSPNTWTFILYVTDLDTLSENAGETMFISKTQMISIISNLMNKGVLFRSSMIHRGLAPARNYPGLRVTLAWKLEEVFS
jgi:predicted 2-oxoglutarate/Fe(II)-dependent dioxygenase YbiX